MLKIIDRQSLAGIITVKKKLIKLNLKKYLLPVLFFWAISNNGFAQDEDSLASLSELKGLSMEELMNIEVTSVSKYPEKITEVASAIQVITGEDIQRSSATNIPEVLRLFTNLQISQLQSNAWIIGSRGFNALFANKLLVLIDGRNVYSPLFAGVNWDVQNVLLEDIERIEVISGPGGTMWGANAVNGVINIITKSAEETQGVYVSAATGNQLEHFGAIRYGGKIGEDLSFRVFAQHSQRDNTFATDGPPLNDKWDIGHAGFRMDYTPNAKDDLIVQGNLYLGNVFGADNYYDSQNFIAGYTHTYSPKAETRVQAFYDRTWRVDIPNLYKTQLQTVDFEVQHRQDVGEAHRFMFGGGYRYMISSYNTSNFMVTDEINYNDISVFIPNPRHMSVYNFFLQDEITLLPKLKLTLGSKIQHNVYTDFEFQPSIRTAFNLNSRNNIWGAVSRAVRTPSRMEVDQYIYYSKIYPNVPGVPDVLGGPEFISEDVLAYEFGYRVQPASNLSFALSTFYNEYDNLYSVEVMPESIDLHKTNGGRGETYGFEFLSIWQVSKNWRLKAGYTYFEKNLESKVGHEFIPALVGIDANHHAKLHSILNISDIVEFDITARYRSEIPEEVGQNLEVPEYFTFDARIAMNVTEWLELSIIGQNLFEENHSEFSVSSLKTDVPRSFYGKITCRF